MSAGDLRSSAPGNYSSMRLAELPIVFGSVGAQKIDDLAVGEIVVSAWVDVLVAFNAATTNVITVGNTGTADLYLAAGDVNEAALGVTPAGGKGPFTQEAAATALNVTYTQTGAAATAGSARVYVLIASVAE